VPEAAALPLVGDGHGDSATPGSPGAPTQRPTAMPRPVSGSKATSASLRWWSTATSVRARASSEICAGLRGGEAQVHAALGQPLHGRGGSDPIAGQERPRSRIARRPGSHEVWSSVASRTETVAEFGFLTQPQRIIATLTFDEHWAGERGCDQRRRRCCGARRRLAARTGPSSTSCPARAAAPTGITTCAERASAATARAARRRLPSIARRRAADGATFDGLLSAGSTASARRHDGRAPATARARPACPRRRPPSARSPRNAAGSHEARTG
jgi:hypothetical protein